MALNTEHELTSIVENGRHKLLRPVQHNSRIVLSRLKRAYGELKSCNGYGLFIPLAGKKIYHTAAETFSVAPGHFILLEYHQDCFLDINSNEETMGINIRVHKSFVDQAYHTLYNSTNKLLDDPSGNTNYDGHFYQGVFHTSDTLLGNLLNRVVKTLDIENEELEMNETELFHEVSTSIILQQQNISACTKRLPAKKKSTQKELFKRLSMAKMIINDDLSGFYDIQTLAKEVSLSPYHFLRSYKSMFGISPHQYMMQRKMEVAAERLLSTPDSIMDIAFRLGFSELPGFSKSFKKFHGVSPAAFRKDARRKF